MSSKECFHFTYLNRAYSISQIGLAPRIEDNSRVVKDSAAKISFSDGRYAAAGLMANFYRIYTDIKEGKRDPSRTDPDLAKKIIASKSFEDFLGDGMYLVFDGTGIENTGGNRGHINAFDAATREKIEPNKLKVCVLKNHQTGELSYSKYDFAQYLMAHLTPDDYSKMPDQIVSDLSFYKNTHADAIHKFESQDYSLEFMSLDEFCQTFKEEIDASIAQSTKIYDEAELTSTNNIKSFENLVSPKSEISMQSLTRHALENNHTKSNEIAQLDNIEKHLTASKENEVSISE